VTTGVYGGAYGASGHATASTGAYSGAYSTSGHSSTAGAAYSSATTGAYGYGSATGAYSTGGATSTGYGFGGLPVYHSSGSATTTTSSSASTTGSVYHSSVHSSSHSAVAVHSASHSYLAKYTTSTGKYTTSTTGLPGATEECQYQKHLLQVVYIKAYVEITRLLAQYEIIIHEHTCDDYVYQTEGQQEKLLEGKLVKMTTTVSSYHHKLEAYMVRIQQAYDLEVEMQSHIKMLTTKCGEMGATVSSLDKVRDAIHIIGVCPGIGKLTFVIPKWTGVYVKGTFDTVDLTDAEVDEAMNQLCEANAPNQSSTSVPVGIRIFYRSAETSELMLRSI
jgi:hypothetical protein